MKIGVFICECGENISSNVDCNAVKDAILKHRNVSYATVYKYMCSDPGQELIKKAIKEHNLDGIVIAACSPQMHEETFRAVLQDTAINPYMLEIANIREQCSWVHDEKSKATQKAEDIIKASIEKLRQDQELYPINTPIKKRALVLGGGITGIQAALDIADAGYETIVVEKSPSIGGHMAMLSETFPTLDCSQCILTPKMVALARHPNIRLYTYAELISLDGYVGNFRAKVRLHPRFVDHKRCTGCSLCWQKCPSKKIPSEFDSFLTHRTAIYIPFPQAVPNKPIIDKENCLYFKEGRCGICAKLCPVGAIDYSMKEKIIELEVGAVIVATGFTLQDPSIYGEYGYGRYKDVITSLQFERLLSASGPTEGKILRPSDGREPKTVVFIQCVGSRDPSKGIKYCSKICCMYTAKHMLLYKHKVPDGQAYSFYIDIRAAGKGYEEFVRRATEEERLSYLRGRVSKIYKDGDKLIVRGIDTLLSEPVEIAADLIVLATAVTPTKDARKVATIVGITADEDGFYSELHPKLRPAETARAGVFIAGCCQGPKDIPESVLHASAAASKVVALFSKPWLTKPPTVARVNEKTCIGCGDCIKACPFGAIEKTTVKDTNSNLLKDVAVVNPTLCQGCGICAAICRSASIDLEGFSDTQLFSTIKAL